MFVEYCNIPTVFSQCSTFSKIISIVYGDKQMFKIGSLKLAMQREWVIDLI